MTVQYVRISYPITQWFPEYWTLHRHTSSPDALKRALDRLVKTGPAHSISLALIPSTITSGNQCNCSLCQPPTFHDRGVPFRILYFFYTGPMIRQRYGCRIIGSYFNSAQVAFLAENRHERSGRIQYRAAEYDLGAVGRHFSSIQSQSWSTAPRSYIENSQCRRSV